MSKFALLIKRNAVGYAEERAKLQKEVAEKQRTEQMTLWKEHLDYSVSKERLYNYQSASSLVLDNKMVDVTAVSTDPSRKTSEKIALPDQNSKFDKQDLQTSKQSGDSMDRQFDMERKKSSASSTSFFELEEEKLRQHEDDVAKKNAAALLRLMSDPNAVDFEYLPSGYVRIVENPGSHSASSTSSCGQVSAISEGKLPITPNSDDQKKLFEDTLVKPQLQPNHSPTTTQPASRITGAHAELQFEEKSRLFPANLLSAPLPFQRQLFTEAAAIQLPTFPYPAAPLEQTVAAPLPPPKSFSIISSTTESTSSASESSGDLLSTSVAILQRTASLKSKHSSDSSIRIPNNLLRDSREFLDEFFAKALQLSNESLPPAPTASIDPLYERPVVQEPNPKEPRVEISSPSIESAQEVEQVKVASELRQVCSAQDILLDHQKLPITSLNPLPTSNTCTRCNSSDALHFIHSQSVPVSPVQAPLSPRTIKGERIRELVGKFEQFAHGNK